MNQNNSNNKNNVRKSLKSKCLIGSIVFLIFGIIIFFVEIGDAFKVLKSPIQLETIEQAKNLKSGDVVNLDITMVRGDIMRETTTYSKYGQEVSSKESARYYIIPFLDLKNIDEWYVTVKLESKDDFRKAEKAMDALENYIKTKEEPTEVIFSFYGVVKDMNDEEKKYIPIGLSTAMDAIYVKQLNKTSTLVLTGVSILAIALSIGYIVYYIKDNKKEKARLEEEKKINNPDNYQAPQNIYVQ